MTQFQPFILVIIVSLFISLPMQSYAAGGYSSFPKTNSASHQISGYEVSPTPVVSQQSPKSEEAHVSQLRHDAVYYPPPLVAIQSWLAAQWTSFQENYLVNGVFFQKLQEFLTNMVINQFMPILNIFNQDKTQAIISSNEASEMVTQRLVPTMQDVGETMVEDVKLNTSHKMELEREVARHNAHNLAHIELQESREMCELSTSVRRTASSWAGSRMGSAVSARRISGGAGGSQEQGAVAEITRRTGSALVYTNPDDMNGAIPAEATTGPAAEAFVEALRAEQPPTESPLVINGCDDHIDVNYTVTIDQRRTAVETKCYYYETPTSTEYTESIQTGTEKTAAMWAWFNNAFPQSYEPPLESRVRESYNEDTNMLDTTMKEFVLGRRTVQASRSVAQNSFIQLINRRKKNPVPDGDQRTILDDAARLVGFPEGSEIYHSPLGTLVEEFQKEPSYEAQLEVLAKWKYFNPQFVTGQSEEADKHNTLIAQGTESVVLYDALQSMQRQEAIIATMLETMLDQKQRELEAQATSINGGG